MPFAFSFVDAGFNPLNAELNPICHLLVLLGAHHILHVSGLRVNVFVLTAFPYKVILLISTFSFS